MVLCIRGRRKSTGAIVAVKELSLRNTNDIRFHAKLIKEASIMKRMGDCGNVLTLHGICICDSGSGGGVMVLVIVI